MEKVAFLLDVEVWVEGRRDRVCVHAGSAGERPGGQRHARVRLSDVGEVWTANAQSAGGLLSKTT